MSLHPLDRKKGPQIHEIRSIALPEVEVINLADGTEVHCLQTDYAPVVRMEIVIDAGRLKEEYPLQSRAAAALLKDGSTQYSREDISAITDRTGGAISIQAGLEFASIQIHSLESQFDLILDIVQDVLLHPTYSETSLKKYIKRRKNRLREDLSINEILAYRMLTEKLFGSEHPYGYNSTPEKYDQLNTESLSAFHRAHYLTGNMKIFLACQHPDLILRKLRSVWANLPGGKTEDFEFNLNPDPGKRFDIKAVNYNQASIRIGKNLFPRHHPDFAGAYFINTMLGGFFGSRLNREIREKQGLTYNIFSTIETFKTAGFFLAGCEAGILNADRVLNLIFLEIDRIQKGVIHTAEVQLVRNYLFGFFISMLDGPINTMELYKVLITEGGSIESFHQMLEKINLLNESDIVELAKKHLKAEDMKVVIVR